MFLRAKREEKARVLEGSDFGGRSSHFWCISDQEGRKILGLQVQRDFKVRTKPQISLNDVWIRKTLIHPWVLIMVGLG